MSSNEIPVESTPFFDALVVDRSARDLFGLPWDYGVTSTQVLEGARKAAESFTKAMEPVATAGPQMEENVHPQDLENNNVTFQEFVLDLEKRFAKKYPKVILADAMWRTEIDGTVTVRIVEHPKPVVQTDETVNAAPTESIEVKTLNKEFRKDLKNEEERRAEIDQFLPTALSGSEVVLRKTGSSFNSNWREEVFLKNQIPTVEVPVDIEQFDIHAFIRQSVEQVMRDNPGAVVTDMSVQPNENGIPVLVFEALKPVSVQTGFEGAENETREILSIGENEADSLYMKTGPWGVDEE